MGDEQNNEHKSNRRTILGHLLHSISYRLARTATRVRGYVLTHPVATIFIILGASFLPNPAATLFQLTATTFVLYSFTLAVPRHHARTIGYIRTIIRTRGRATLNASNRTRHRRAHDRVARIRRNRGIG